MLTFRYALILIIAGFPRCIAQGAKKVPPKPAVSLITSQRTRDALLSVEVAANDYTRAIPGFTCHESISSSGATGFMGFHRSSVKTEGEIRALRTDGSLKEERVYFEKDGKPTTPKEKERIDFPYFLGEAFAPPLRTYLASEQRSCLRFKLSSPTRLDFEAPIALYKKKMCPDIAPQAKGFITFDPLTHTISHYERTIPKDVAANTNFAEFGSVDYFPVGRDGQLYMLPMQIYGRKSVRDAPNVFDAHYSECRLHKANVIVHTEASKPIQH